MSKSPAKRSSSAPQANRSTRVEVWQEQLHIGPLPSPSDLAEYEDVLPGAAERIIRMAELPLEMAADQNSHRIQIESKIIQNDVFLSRVGLFMGYSLAAGTVGGGIWLINNGRDTAGLTAIVTAVAGLVGIFVYSDVRKRQERKENKKAIEAAQNTR